MKPVLQVWRWLCILAALEAGAAFFALTRVPSGGGLSLARIAMLGFLAVFLAGSALAAARADHLRSFLSKPASTWLGFSTALLATLSLFLLRDIDPQAVQPYYERLGPIIWLLLLVGVEYGLASLVARHGIEPGAARDPALWRPTVIALAVALAAYLFVAITRVGLTPDSAYWGEPGVPILPWQLALAFIGSAGAWLVTARMAKSSWRTDAIVGALIWLLAAALWLGVPNGVLKNSFYAPLNPPANQPFPNSDAGYYDSMAHSLLIGYPYQGDIPTRPLYVVFLAALHLLLGERYSAIIVGQTLLLALIPVAIYFLGKRMQGRMAGLLAAFLVTLREWNSLLVSSQTRVSNSKMLLVDLPTLLLILVACVLVARWLERRERPYALLSGGALGLLVLLRTQSLLILAAVLLLAVLAYGSRERRLPLSLALLLLGVVAGIGPWLLHNYLQTGQLALDAPFQYQIIASQYRYTGNLNLDTTHLEGRSVAGILLEFTLKDPGFVAGFIGSHTAATLIDSLLVLPLRARYDGLLSPLNLYWMSWPAGLDLRNGLLLLPYLGIIAVGLGASWRRLRWAGLAPLAFALAYALANGVGRFSGWRYDLPADWIAYFYVAIGLAELFRLLVESVGAMKTNPYQPSAGRDAFSWRAAAVILSVIALVGALPWMAQGIRAPRYAGQDLTSLAEQLASSEGAAQAGFTRADVDAFLLQPQASLQVGRLLYPRFFPRDAGLPSAHPWPAFAVRDFPRIGFLLLNQSRHDVVIATRQAGPDVQQGADAIVLGCERGDYIEARLLFLPANGAMYQAGPLSEPCN